MMMGSTKISEESLTDKGAGDVREDFDTDLLRAFDVADREVRKEIVIASNVKLNRDRLRLSGDGIFYSLQGEGITMGLPAVFLRLHVCNLRCVWCDTYYTWNPHTEEFWTESYELGVPEVVRQAEETWGCGRQEVQKRLVITGGEPLLQKKLVDTLIQSMPEWCIEIETNGTIMPTELQLEKVQLNCSPKLANSGCSDRARIKPDVLRTISRADSQFKFVVTNEKDVAEMEKDFLPYLSPGKVVLMPQGVTAQEINQNARNIVDVDKPSDRHESRRELDCPSIPTPCPTLS